jgi:hypothetical protein
MPTTTNPLTNVECEDLVDELCDRMDLDDDERAKFKNRCMTRAGYKAVPQYVPTDDKDDDNKGSKKGHNGNGSRSRKSDEDEWYNT